MLKIRAITAHYTPSQWGVKMIGGKVQVWCLWKRTDDDKSYLFYGDDRDTYKEFEEDGFIVSEEVKSYADAIKWLEQNVNAGE